METKLKICGITRLEDARYCAGAGVDYLGFVQYEKSPRYVSPETAREIIDWLHGPEPVGVFVNEAPDVVNDVAARAGFTHVQLHGTESPEVCRQIALPIIKAIHVVHDASAEQLRWMMEPYRDVATYFLLDTHNTSLWGGSGESFNWRLARDLGRDFPIFLAGGINADNVEEAIETMRPYAIDLSSSLESEPGIKDFEKLSHFLEVYQSVVDQQ